MQEAIIVGAGPTRQPADSNTSCAAALHAVTVEALEPLGVVSGAAHRGREVPIFRIRDRDAVLAEIAFDGIKRSCKNVTEAHLLTKLKALEGAVERPMESIGIERVNDFVVSMTGMPTGSTRSSRPDGLGCDGNHSVIRERAGIAFHGGQYE